MQYYLFPCSDDYSIMMRTDKIFEKLYELLLFFLIDKLLPL
jgi:hypothetical protein